MLDLNMTDKELLEVIFESSRVYRMGYMNDTEIVDLVIDVLQHRLNLGD